MVFPIQAVPHLSKSASGSNNFADLLPLLKCLDQVLVQATIAAELHYGSQSAGDPFRGLYINQDEVGRLFSRSPGAPRLNPNEEGLREPLLQAVRTNPLMARLAERFGLEVFDLVLILLALAPEVDLRYERLFGYLQDDVTRRRPTVDLALNLFCASAEEKIARRIQFAPESPLIKHDLLQLIPDPSQNAPPLLAHYLKLDELITNFLLDQPILDSRLSSFCQMREPMRARNSFALGVEVKQALTSLALRARDTNQPLRLYFSGTSTADKRLAAETMSGETRMPLLVVDLNDLLTEMDFRRTLKRVFRQSWFHNAILYLEGCDALHSESRSLVAKLVAASLMEHTGIAVLAGEQSCPLIETIDSNRSVGLIDVPFSIPRFSLRRECWKASLQASNILLAETEIDTLASRFQLTPPQVSQAVVHACNQSLWRAAVDPMRDPATPQPTFSDLCSSARAQSQHQLETLARKIEPVYKWKDIVLPEEILEQLRELCSRVAERRRVMGEWGFGRKLSLGKGVSALFAGPSGTGKTMAAEIVANELELELYKIDLSGIVSKYIGETEKNLDRIFTTAENANAILFFDEADALFGKRSEVRDSHDRYANIEISYLLQKMEQYEGIAILATNLRQNLDDAFLRRLQIVVEFPFPDEAQRRQIWEVLFPSETPRSEEIDFGLLASQFRIAGGNIKNIVLGSAFLAAADSGRVDMTHLWQSAQREYQKLGKILAG
jgi:AAA+ superfamily predicted ATPase